MRDQLKSSPKKDSTILNIKTILKVSPKSGNFENPDPLIPTVCEIHTSRGTEPLKGSSRNKKTPTNKQKKIVA